VIGGAPVALARLRDWPYLNMAEHGISEKRRNAASSVPV
jgi:hypothetical protein